MLVRDNRTSSANGAIIGHARAPPLPAALVRRGTLDALLYQIESRTKKPSI
jgi:hypothetical protein